MVVLTMITTDKHILGDARRAGWQGAAVAGGMREQSTRARRGQTGRNRGVRRRGKAGGERRIHCVRAFCSLAIAIPEHLPRRLRRLRPFRRTFRRCRFAAAVARADVAVGRRALCQKASAARRTPSRGRPPPFGLGRGRRAGRPTNLLTRQTGENRATKALLRPRFEAGAAMGAFNAPPCAPGSTGGAKGASNARPALNTASDECDQPHDQRRNVPRDGRHHAAHDRLRRSPAHASPSRRETWQPSRRAVVFTRRRAAARSSGFRRCAPVCTRHATDAAPNLGVHQWSRPTHTMAARLDDDGPLDDGGRTSAAPRVHEGHPTQGSHESMRARISNI